MAKLTIKPEQKAAFFSYLRAGIATVLTVVIAGETSPKALWAAAFAAFVPPIIRWINPNDASFGRSK